MIPIHLRNLPKDNPRGAETFNHPEFIDFIFSYLKPECYLELGVRGGETFTLVAKHCKRAIGVDILSTNFPMMPNMEMHVMSTDAYFNQINNETKYDAVFIDADHSYEQSLKDFLNVKDMVIEDGFIFFHDSYPFDDEYITPGACGEVYKTLLYIKQNLIDEFEVLTLPFNPGVSMVKKMKRDKQLIYK